MFTKLVEGHGPLVNYVINDNEYTKGYYLVDDIYPSWATFVKTISNSLGNIQSWFASQQESARKDVERAFEVL